MVPAVASALAGVLDDKDARAFAASEGIVAALTPVLRASDRSGVQAMYEVPLCFWLMSFSADLRIDVRQRGGDRESVDGLRGSGEQGEGDSTFWR